MIGQDVSLSADVHTGRIHAGQVQRDVEPIIGLPHIHRHPHRGPSSRQQLVRQPIHLPERITERVESQHTHSNLLKTGHGIDLRIEPTAVALEARPTVTA